MSNYYVVCTPETRKKTTKQQAQQKKYKSRDVKISTGTIVNNLLITNCMWCHMGTRQIGVTTS